MGFRTAFRKDLILIINKALYLVSKRLREKNVKDKFPPKILYSKILYFYISAAALHSVFGLVCIFLERSHSVSV